MAITVRKFFLLKIGHNRKLWKSYHFSINIEIKILGVDINKLKYLLLNDLLGLVIKLEDKKVWNMVFNFQSICWKFYGKYSILRWGLSIVSYQSLNRIVATKTTYSLTKC